MKASEIELKDLRPLNKRDHAHLAFLFTCNDEALGRAYKVDDFIEVDFRILRFMILHGEDKDVTVGKLLKLDRKHEACGHCIYLLKKLKMVEMFACDVCKNQYFMDKFKQPCPYCGAKWENTGVLFIQG